MKNTIRFPTIADDVSIVFLDHCQDGESSVLCTVRGVVFKVDETEIGIESWTTHEHNSPENRVRFVIVRSTIREIVTKKEVSLYVTPKKTKKRRKRK